MSDQHRRGSHADAVRLGRTEHDELEAPPRAASWRRASRPGPAGARLPAHRHRPEGRPARASARSRSSSALSTLGHAAVHRRLLRDQAERAISGAELLERVGLSTKLLGLGLGLALFCIGVGAIHWAKKLMPDDEIVDGAQADALLRRGPRRGRVDASRRAPREPGSGRRKLIRNSLLGALAPLGLLAIIPLRDLGPLPGNSLERHGLDARATGSSPTPRAGPIKPEDIPIGGVVHVLPRGHREEPSTAQRARPRRRRSLIRLAAGGDHLPARRKDWDVSGIVCYSKVCTHVGCPVGLYEQRTHHLLCPCHQSTFDVADDGKVIFGPAARPLPQLPLTLDARATWWRRATSRNRSARASGSAGSRRHGTLERAAPARSPTSSTTGSARRNVRQDAARARSSPTTGRSCSARSRSTASSSCC